MITVNHHQDSPEKLLAVINDGEGNTIASLPANGYGYETKTQAEEAAEKWLNSRSHLDIEGGGVRHITPHKGGRTIKRSTDVTPETNERLRLLAEHGISLGDLIEDAAIAKLAVSAA